MPRQIGDLLGIGLGMRDSQSHPGGPDRPTASPGGHHRVGLRGGGAASPKPPALPLAHAGGGSAGGVPLGPVPRVAAPSGLEGHPLALDSGQLSPVWPAAGRRGGGGDG